VAEDTARLRPNRLFAIALAAGGAVAVVAVATGLPVATGVGAGLLAAVVAVVVGLARAVR